MNVLDNVYRCLAILTIVFLFSACGPDPSEIAVLQAAESLAREDSMENELAATLTEINDNLEKIRQRQGLISLAKGEGVSVKDEILENIATINWLLEENRRKNELLNMQVNKLRRDKTALTKLVDQTKAQIQLREDEIAELKSRLERESFKVSELGRQLDQAHASNEALSRNIDSLSTGSRQLDRELNTAWFAYGTGAQLLSKNIVQSTGGVLGIGKKDRLSDAFHRNKGVFTPIDIREVTAIPLHGRKPKVLTDHPKASFTIESEEGDEYSKLVIKDPVEFWSRTRFLVVEVK